MKIRLNEIPEEGRDYLFDRQSGELNQELEDLLASRPYAVRLFIKPIGNAYEMRGSVQTTLAGVCSKCGDDFDLPIDRKVTEILFQDHEEHRKSQNVHGNQSVNFLGDELAMTPVRGDIFDVGDYAHEAIALAEPFYPVCGPNGGCLRAAEIDAIVERLEAEAEIEERDPVKASPFAVLKNLDLERKN